MSPEIRRGNKRNCSDKACRCSFEKYGIIKVNGCYFSCCKSRSFCLGQLDLKNKNDLSSPLNMIEMSQ